MNNNPHRSHALRGNALPDAPAFRSKTTLERQRLNSHAEHGNYKFFHRSHALRGNALSDAKSLEGI